MNMNSVFRREPLRPWSRRAVVALALAFPAAAWAQGTPAVPDAEGELKLTPAQRDLIYSSIANQTHKSTGSPPNWAARVGEAVPQGIELTPVPPTIAEVVPQTRGHSYAFVASQVLIVNPENRRVIEIIAQKA